MQYEEINIDALKAALNLLVGEQVAEMVQKTYTAFVTIMEKSDRQNYSAGYNAGYAQAESDLDVLEMANDGTLDEIEYEQSRDEAFDADQFAVNTGGEYDESLVQDSGDEA